MNGQPIVVVGAGGFGREVVDVIETLGLSAGGPQLLGVIDDGPTPVDLGRLAARGVPYLGTVDDFLAVASPTDFVIGIASPRARRFVDEKMVAGGHSAATLVHPSATLGSQVGLGPGTIICAGARLTTNIRLGRHVHVNLNATIGHDAQLGDYVTVYPSAAVSGNVVLEDEVSMGVGSVVLQGLTVGARTFVGASALVTKGAGSDLVLKGVPAR